jgi:hypothetical protein
VAKSNESGLELFNDAFNHSTFSNIASLNHKLKKINQLYLDDLSTKPSISPPTPVETSLKMLLDSPTNKDNSKLDDFFANDPVALKQPEILLPV